MKTSTHISSAGILVAAFIAAAGLANAGGFADVTASAGVEFWHEGDPGMPIGAGAAFVDVDGDGDDDLYAVDGENCNRLFENTGGTFNEVPNAAGAGACADISHGVAAADYDNDGDQDLHVANNGQNRLLKNLYVETGTLSFVDVTNAAGMGNDGGYNSSSATWADYNNDGNLDLFVGNHVYQMGPLACHPDYLWHNNGNGTFVDVGPQTGVHNSGVLNKAGCALAATFSDFDNDGDPDLMVVNDFGYAVDNDVPNRLFRNDGPASPAQHWTFTDISAASGFDYAQNGMGIAIGDIDGNGLFDYYASDFNEGELAYNNGDETFTNVAAEWNAEVSDPHLWNFGLVSWGAGFFDLDRDGWEDLTVCNGGADQEKWPGMLGGEAYVHENPCYVLRSQYKNGEPYLEMHTQLGVTSERYYRGLAFSDYDDDGDMDMYFGNLRGYNSLYRNDIPSSNHWLKVKTVGTLGNRDGIGARVTVVAAEVSQMREIDGGSSFMSRNTLTAHFGLAGVDLVDVAVDFPSGVRQELQRISVDRTITVVEPRITATFDEETATEIEGNTVIVPVTIRNHTAEGRAMDLWLSYVAPDGTETTIIGPSRIVVPGNIVAARNMVVPITAEQPALGQRRIGVRIGSHSLGATHRDHMLVIIDPAP
jgi:hypothetical protein